MNWVFRIYDYLLFITLLRPSFNKLCDFFNRVKFQFVHIAVSKLHNSLASKFQTKKNANFITPELTFQQFFQLQARKDMVIDQFIWIIRSSYWSHKHSLKATHFFTIRLEGPWRNLLLLMKEYHINRLIYLTFP